MITPVRYAVSSDHIRIIQVASIHELMEKYKSSHKKQRKKDQNHHLPQME
ncbi:hypothetical protein MUB16_04100 [Priestia sp. OVL9]|nr:hypothetical protein [Priestia sp. OVL9]